MKYAHKYLLTALGASAATAIGNFLVIFAFNTSGSSLGLSLLRFAPFGLIYIAIMMALAWKNAALFGAQRYLFTSADEDTKGLLKKLGGVPIKSIALVILVQAVLLLIGIFLFGNKIGVSAEMKPLLYCASLSVGMVVGTFVYVANDGLVSRVLLSHRIVKYPLDLREDRQGLKACIIPLVIALVSGTFAFTVAMLSMVQTELVAAADIAWGFPLMILAAFFSIITTLAITLKKNTTILYRSILSHLEGLASGKKDLTKRIHVTSIDELGSIAGMMNVFCESVFDGVVEIKKDQADLSRSSGRLDTNVKSMSSAIEKISASVKNVNDGAEQQMKGVEQASAVVHEIAHNIESLDGSITTQSVSVSQASSSIEEMVGNMASIGNATEKMSNYFESVGAVVADGIAAQKVNADQVQKVREQSMALQDANKMIANIAAQTNLLAMNAAIEAAHAGNAGRGFSVVADEIRKLAETSARESKKISAELKQLSSAIDAIVKSTDASSSAFGAVSEKIEGTKALVSEVGGAMREQKLGAEQILEALRRMNDITFQVKTGSAEMKVGNKVMLDEIEKLQSQVRTVSSGMSDIARDMMTITRGSEAGATLAADTKAALTKIEAVVNDFDTLQH